MKILNNLNLFQTLALLGIVFSLVAHGILIFLEKAIDNYWAVYPTWVLVFIFGTIIKKFVGPDDHHH
ncbi:MAG: hypothetical protein ACK4ND_05315 [Cytophagaceae bacterium]